MSYHSSRRKKRRLQRGEKIVLKYGIPAAIVMAILIQITVRGVPVFFDKAITFLEDQSWKSRQIIAAYAVKKAKSGDFNKEKNFQTDQTFNMYTTYGKQRPGRMNEDALKSAENFRRAEQETWDEVFQEIGRREKKEEIQEYQKIFEDEKEDGSFSK
ncbi:MAG: hypothetical protein KKD31_19770 [Bacteroidetes bacterium]|nr:hypothetical protein [Bacteroidota bacterium]